jgi:hypothetical protein
MEKEKVKKGTSHIWVRDDRFPRMCVEDVIKVQDELLRIFRGWVSSRAYLKLERDIGIETQYVIDGRGKCIVYLKKDSGEYTKISLKPKEIPESSLGITVSEEIIVEDYDTLLEKIRTFKK